MKSFSMQQFFKNAAEVWASSPHLQSKSVLQIGVPAARVVQSVSRETMHQTKKFFDPTIFQKCWRGSGRVALIAARRQRNPRAIPLAHGEGGEKSDRFSRRGGLVNVINLTSSQAS